VENLRPLTGSRPLAFVPIVASVGALAAVAVHLAGRRDVEGASLRSEAPRSRLELLGDVRSLALRLTAPVTAGWIVGLAAVGFVGGMVGQDAAGAYRDSKAVGQVVGRLGASTDGAFVLGVIFLAACTLISVCAATQLTAAREEEASGVLDHLLARPVSRWQWLSGRLAAAAIGVTAATLAMGIGAWVGSLGATEGVALPRLIEASINILPPAFLVIGVGVMAIGLAPRWVGVVVYAVVLWSFVVEFLAAAVEAPALLLDSSLLHHVSPAPAADPNWTAALVMVLLSIVCTAVGATTFARRDLSPA
jgi:ABC-2 type transport system permease protein